MMDRWEYLRVSLEATGFVAGDDAEQHWTAEPSVPFPGVLPDDFLDLLNALGNEGWELIPMLDWPGRHASGREVLFRRRILAAPPL